MPRARKGIKKDNTGKWALETRVSVNGVAKKVHLRGFNSEAEAYAEKVRIVNMYKQGTIANDRPMYFSELATLYYEDYKTSVKETTSSNRFSTYKKYFIDEYDKKTIDQVVNSLSLRSFKQSLVDKELSSDWINKLIRYMVKIIEFAYNRGWINVDQFKNSKLELKPVYVDESSIKEKSIWSKVHFKAFLDTFSVNDRNYVMFKLFMHLGCRVSELRGLQVKHFNCENNTIYICQQATSKISGPTRITTPKTKSSVRLIDISDDISTMLTDYISTLDLKMDDFLFFSFLPNTPIGEQTIRASLKKHISLADVPAISTHRFRHTHTTWILSGDLSLNEIGQVSKRLGHRDKSVTLDIYFHIHEKTSSKLLDNLL